MSAVSFHLIEALKTAFNSPKSRFRRISNTADAKTYKPHAHVNQGPKSNSIVHISSLDDRQKNFSSILKSAKSFRELGFDFTLDVIGKGEELEAHQKEAKRLGIDKNVIFHGLQSKEKIADFLRKARFLVLFSNYETQSCVAIESIMCGTPVLTSNIGGVNEVINSTNGILIEPFHHNSLLDGLVNMWNTAEQFDSRQIAKAAKQYNYEHIGKDFHDMYQSVFEE
ncbi:MAG: hypothetical protein Salg2KO_22720 [Salibacteraceae bacterium]